MLHAVNTYYVPNVDITGYLCKTNLPTNTAFRGFGGPQGLFVCETWISQVANRLGVNPEKVCRWGYQPCVNYSGLLNYQGLTRVSALYQL